MNRRIATIAIAALLMMAANMERFMAHAQTQPRPQPVPAQTQTKAPVASALPNGATSLNETYQDWVVLCASAEKGRLCVMTQQQRKSDTNQLVLAMELTSISASEARGTLILPFGLQLADGVTLQIDDSAVSKPIAFATCLPAGCVVPVFFDAAMLKALRAGTSLKLVARAHDNGQNVSLAISLKGFATAQDRAAALAKS